jgi:hypothetical protein
MLYPAELRGLANDLEATDRPVPTKLPTNSMGRLLYRIPKSRVELGGSVFLHRRADMAVQVECDTDRGVPEPFLCDLGVNASQ